MEAADVLCPKEAKLFRKGGAALTAAILKQDPWAEHLGACPGYWLGGFLHTALSKRPDLFLTGRDLARGIHSKRVTVPHEDLVRALDPDQWRKVRVSLGISLRPDTNIVTVNYSGAMDWVTVPESIELLDVRVEAAKGKRPAEEGPGRPASKHAYTEEACRAWFMLRVATWGAAPPPKSSACRAAAMEFFSGPIPRDPFVRLRNQIVPASWKRSGPRGPRR